MEPTLPRRMASAPRPSRAATSLRRRRSRRQGALSAEAQRRAALCPLHSMTNAISEMQCCPTQRCLARAEDASVTTFPSRGSHGVKNRFCTLICTSLLSQGLYCSFRKCTPQRERARKMGGLWRTPRTLLDPPPHASVAAAGRSPSSSLASLHPHQSQGVLCHTRSCSGSTRRHA